MKTFLRTFYEEREEELSRISRLGNLKYYEDEFREWLLSKDISPSNYLTLFSKIKKHKIILVGDYHTSYSPKKALTKFLKSYIKLGKPFSVALEAFNEKDSKLVEKLIKKKDYKGLSKVLKEFPISPMVELLNFLEDYGVSIKSIDSAKFRDPWRRDHFMAKRINAAASKEKVFVLIGQYHISPNHIGKFLQDYLAILVNPEDVYWKLEEKNPFSFADVVKIEDNVFCYFNSHPLFEQQSFINWLQDIEEVEYTEELAERLEDIVCKFYHLKPLRNIEVFTFKELDIFMDVVKANISDKREREYIVKQIKRNASIYLPPGYIFLSIIKPALLVEEITHHYFRTFNKPKTKFDEFFARTINEAIAYFTSKLIDPKRKCKSLKAYKTSKSRKEKVLGKVIENNLKFFKGEATLPLIPKEAELIEEFPNAMGYIMGEEIYKKFNKNKFSLRKIGKILKGKVNNYFLEYISLGEACFKECHVKFVKQSR